MSMDDTRHRPGRLADRVREGRQRDVHIYRATMAFGEPEATLDHMGNVEQAAKFFQALVGEGVTEILDASFAPNFGAGEWGVEPGFTMEAATPKADAFVRLVARFLRVLRQECAYVTVDGRHAYEIASDGTVTPIKGE